MTNVDYVPFPHTEGEGAWPHQPPVEPPTGAQPGATVPPRGGLVPGGYGGTPTAPPGGQPSGRSGGRKGALVGGAVVAALALLAGSFLIGTRVGKTDDIAAVAPSTTSSSTAPSTQAPSTSTPPTTSTPPSTTPAPGGGSTSSVDEASVKAEALAIQKYVEKDRGLSFKNDVPVKVLGSAAFKQRVLDEFGKEADNLRKQGQLLQALGLVPADADPVEVQKSLLGEGVLGFYDPKSKELVVKGDQMGPFLREIMAHELTHAVDDQNFGLDRPDLEKRTDGSEWSWLALVEGSARRVEYDYVRQLSDADKQTLVQEKMSMSSGSGMSDPTSFPLALAAIIQSPYDYGEPFVRDVLQRHGQAGLDKAFAEPPSTSEQILQPDKFESREGAKNVGKPPADGQVVQEGTLGEIMTGFLVNGNPLDNLLNGLGGNEDDPLGGLGGLLGGLGGNTDDPTQIDQAMSALLGKADKVKNWGGDHYVLWKTGSDVCVRVDWTMDTAADVQNLRTQLDKWAQQDGKGKVESLGDTTRMTRCASGAASSGGGNVGQ